MNKKGKVNGFFISTINTSLPEDCGFLLAGKLDFFNDSIKMDQIYRSFVEVRELMRKEEQRIIELSANGNRDAKFVLLSTGRFSFDHTDPLVQMRDLITSGSALVRHTIAFVLIKMRQKDAILNTVSDALIPETDAIMKSMNNEETFRNRLITTIINDLISGFEPQELLSMTWYEMGLAAYHIDDNLMGACHFWNKARQIGHPFVLSDSVIIPNVDIVRCEF